MKRDTVIGIGLIVGVAAVAVAGWRLLPSDSHPEATGRPTDACPAKGPAGLVGLDLRTGEEQWTNVVGNDVANVWSPGPDGDLSSGDSPHAWVISAEGKVRRIVASTGAVDRCPAVKALQPEELGRPVPVDDTGAWARDRVVGVVEVVEDDGSHRWEVKGSYLVGSSTGGVVVRDDLGQSCCAEGGLDGPIRVLEPATGEVRWTADLVGSSAIVTADHLVVVGEGRRGDSVSAPFGAPEQTTVTAYDLTDGAKAWSIEVDGVTAQAKADAGLILVGQVVDGPALTAIDEDTGVVRWTSSLSQPGRGGPYTESSYVTAAAVADDTVVVSVTSTAPHRD